MPRDHLRKLTATGALALAPILGVLFMAPHADLNAARTAINCADVTEIPGTECQALLDLYNSTDGPNWSDSPANNWDVTTTPCSWAGVTCSEGHVTRLTRGNVGLTGTLPGSLGQLTHLLVLHLYDNQLTGPLPPELGDLDNLQQLFLTNNQLTGTIPPEWGDLASMQNLSLGNNPLSGTIPSELGNLVTLEELDLTDNQLSGPLPPELGNLANLKYLYLYRNQLTGTIPSQFGNLTGLLNLSLQQNQLSGAIPPELGNLANLHILSLQHNRLSSAIPPELGNLGELRTFYLNANTLTGNVPLSLAGLITLNNVNLAYNGLWAQNQSVADFLNDKDPDWAETQTVPPTAISVTQITSSSVQVAWQPISYTQDGGYYQVHHSPTSGGPYTLASGVTADKTASSYLVEGLTPGTTTYFAITTFTPAHISNTNPITSAFSVEVALVAERKQLFLPLVMRNWQN